MSVRTRIVFLVTMTFALAIALAPAGAAAAEGKPIAIAGDTLKVVVPEGWVVKEPASRIVEHEFAIPAVEGDKQDGRAIGMSAGGTIDANVERWIGQFTQPDGSDTAERVKKEDFTVGKYKVHVVDISGTYEDRPRPAAPGVKREGYRMLGGIIETPDAGNYYLKFYGPALTVTEQEKPFVEMLRGLKPN